MTIRIAIVGLGKIARDEHLPAIAADPAFSLAAICSGSGDPGLGVPWFPTPAAMFDGMAGRLDAIAICTPPSVRHAVAATALVAGVHVLLEKPPAATLGEIDDLVRLAAACSRSVFAAWHSQHAAGVAGAAEMLAGERIARLRIVWREDVRKWHPGQEWIWEPSGFGVFDPGINALSIATRILPMPLFVREARLLVPVNRQAPIAAALRFAGDDHGAEFDWRHDRDEEWTITVETESGRRAMLTDGGAQLCVDGAAQAVASEGEYPGLYRRFAELVEARASEVDRAPLRIVADAFLVGRRDTVAPFD